MITIQVKENLEIWKLTGAKKEDIVQHKFGCVQGAVYTIAQFSGNTHIFMLFGLAFTQSQCTDQNWHLCENAA